MVLLRVNQEKEIKGKPANKNPVFREGNGVGKLLKAVLTC